MDRLDPIKAYISNITPQVLLWVFVNGMSNELN